MDGEESLQFSERLRLLRQAAGLTQEELAERAGLSVKAISALERGRRQRPYPHTIRALADALGLSEEERAALTQARPRRSGQPVAAGSAPPRLPEPPAPLIGRERELDEIATLLRADAHRMVTLTGAGGVGKTRLAIELAYLLADDLDGNVAFIPLATISDPALVLPTIAQSIGVTPAADTPIHEVLARHIDTPWLLVLDNIEQVLDVAPDIAALLVAAPSLKLLATSRAPLRIRAEHEYPLRPLDLPDLSTVPVVDDVARSSSVQLFLERAREASPAFGLTQANCAAIAAICRRLDGLPLAIELVAARIRVLSPTDLLARLDHILPLLVGGSRDLPQRQQTMQAAINWSYELLRPAEQVLFRRLSVFAGGWTLDAAEEVTAWGDIPAMEVANLLASLVEQSLVVTELDADGPNRYRMLEPIRQFASGLVDEEGERNELAERHFLWCLAMARQAEDALRGPEQQQWLIRLEQEHDNLRVGLAWIQQDPSRKTVELEMADGLWLFWETRGYLTEGRRWLDHALTDSESVPIDLRAHAFNSAGNLARDQGDHEEAVRLHEISLELYQQSGDAYGMGKALNNLANIMLDQGNYARATTLYAEALLYFRELNKEWDIANTVCNLGIAFGHRGDYEQACRLLDEALMLRRNQREPSSIARSMDALGEVMRKRGDIEEAWELHQESLAIRRSLGDIRGLAIGLNNLGIAEGYRGNLDTATELIGESLEIRRNVGNDYGAGLSLAALGRVLRLQGRDAEALASYKEALRLQKSLGINEWIADCLRGIAAIAVEHSAARCAVRLLGASEALRDVADLAIPLVDRDEHERILATAREHLTDAQFGEAWSAGSVLTLEQAIEEALAVRIGDD